MTPNARQRAINALTLKPPIPGLVPAMELEFQLTWERFRRNYHSGDDYAATSTYAERKPLLLEDAQLFVDSCRTYDLCAVMLPLHLGGPGLSGPERAKELIGTIRELSGDELLMMCHGDATLSLPDGNSMWTLTARMADDKDALLSELDRWVDGMLAESERLLAAGVEAFAQCADYCYNTGPWCSPAMFREFVTPFLARLTKGQREMGAYVIKHTDGNIMPILDQLLEANPHAIHSLDPQGGVDIAEVKRICGDRVCLIGNVNCGLVQTGTEEEVIESARYALDHGMPGGGFIFALSNVAFRGMPLERYELVQRVRHEHGIYA
jgi:uroporphyrinogen decarboxylase